MVWLTNHSSPTGLPLFSFVVFRFTIGLLFMNPYYDRILCVHRTHLVSNCILDFCFFIIHLSWTWKHWHSHTVFKLSCSACSARTSRLSVIGSACVLSDRSFGKLWLSPVDYGEICFTHLFLLPGYCPLRLSVRTCGAGVWMLRFLVHWRRLLSFVFLLTLARKLWLLSLSII